MFDHHFRLLLSENRRVRKQNLDELTTRIKRIKKLKVSTDTLLAVKSFVYPCLNDDSGACRESAVQLVRVLLRKGCVEDIVPIVFIIHKRMGKLWLNPLKK